MKRGEILKEAERLTHGNRNSNYGEPLVNHQRIADIWSVILGVKVRPDQVALCMVGVKIARGAPALWSWVKTKTTAYFKPL